MKKLIQYMGYMLIPAILVSCSKDDDNPGPENPGGTDPVAVNLEEDFSHLENAEGREILINLEAPAPEAGQVSIRVAAEEGLQVYTMPSAFNNIITVDIEKDDKSVSFTLVPGDDDLIGGMKSVVFTIASVTTGFAIGDRNSVHVEIIDDELQGKPKFFETSGGGWKTSNTYFYRPDGQVARVEWRSETPGIKTGTDTYYYLDGKIARINNHEGRDEYYYWENDRIVSSEVIDNGVRKSYDLYAYDDAGNIGSRQNYNLQPSGDYLLSYTYVYLYFTDGNLYKQLTFIPAPWPVEYEVISTRTYENYLDKPNLFLVNEVVPTIMTQFKLPGSFRLEENGADLTYFFSYEYDDAGRAVRRITDGEVTTYGYY